MLGLASLVSTVLFIVAGFAVGLRLLALARRTGGLPEWTMGIGLFSLVGLGYPANLATMALMKSQGRGGLTAVMAVLSSLLMNGGWMAVWVFTWKVFRAESKAARATASLAIAILAGMVVWGAVNAFNPDETGAVARMVQMTVATLGMGFALYAWTGVESFRYYGLMRKRLALGMADPVVTNRFLLWGITALLSSASLAAPAWSIFAGRLPFDDPFVRMMTALAGSGCAVALALAFLPPAGYVRWLKAGSPAKPSA